MLLFSSTVTGPTSLNAALGSVQQPPTLVEPAIGQGSEQFLYGAGQDERVQQPPITGLKQ